MKNLDLNLLSRAFIGADQITALLEGISQHKQSSFPPFNIEKITDDQYLISMAVAGFSEEELSINSDENKLTIEGIKPNDTQERQFVHQGLANRNFSQEFQLGQYIFVDGAELENGILNIQLVRELPEAKKPKEITINRVKTT